MADGYLDPSLNSGSHLRTRSRRQETWDFIADLFADREEFDAWRRLLPLK
jgi:hypothetical protein